MSAQSPRRPSKADLQALLDQFDDPETIVLLLESLALTRNGATIQPSVQAKILRKLLAYPAEARDRGIRIYLEKNMGDAGKREAYLYGIIRRENDFPNRGNGNGEKPDARRDMLKDAIQQLNEETNHDAE